MPTQTAQPKADEYEIRDAPPSDEYEVRDAETPKPQSLMSRIRNDIDHTLSEPPQDTGWRGGLENFGSGFASALLTPVLHPLDMARSVGDSIVASGMNPNIPGIPLMASTGNQQIDQSNENMVRDAREGVNNQTSQMRANPMRAVGQVTGGLALAPLLREFPTEVPSLDEIFPTRAKAGRLFDDVMSSAADQPVSISPGTLEPLERTQQLAMAGGKPFGAADKLYQRLNTVNPLTYREARDFAQNMSLSPEEKMGLKRSMQYEVPKMAKSFNEDVGRAADAAGKGAEYQKAMNMYRRASRNAKIANGFKKYGTKAAMGAIGAGSLYELGQAMKQ